MLFCRLNIIFLFLLSTLVTEAQTLVKPQIFKSDSSVIKAYAKVDSCYSLTGYVNEKVERGKKAHQGISFTFKISNNSSSDLYYIFPESLKKGKYLQKEKIVAGYKGKARYNKLDGNADGYEYINFKRFETSSGKLFNLILVPAKDSMVISLICYEIENTKEATTDFSIFVLNKFMCDKMEFKNILNGIEPLGIPSLTPEGISPNYKFEMFYKEYIDLVINNKN